MRSLLVAGVLMLSASAAVAGPYGGLAVGPAPGQSDNLDALTASGRSGRLLGGYRFSKLSIEGAYTGYKASSGYDASQLQIAGKYNHSLGSGFDVYGRLGLHHTTLDAADTMYDVSGTGPIGGAGFELKLPLTGLSASLFVEYSIAMATLEGDRYDLEHTQRLWMLGFTVGM